MPDVKLDAVDAGELAEMLQFFGECLTRDRGRLAASLADFVGHPAYGLNEFVRRPGTVRLLFGGSDGQACSAMTTAHVPSPSLLGAARSAATGTLDAMNRNGDTCPGSAPGSTEQPTADWASGAATSLPAIEHSRAARH
jgi:hypothetical protein